jgi:hypothetical protein
MQNRVRATVELLHRRGYALPAPRLGEVLLGGREDPQHVLDAAHADSDLAVTEGVVHLANARGVAERSLVRARRHGTASARWEGVLEEYADLLSKACPWLKALLVSGSYASGGFVEEDDIDVSLVVESGSKHLAYLAALAASLPISWRHRSKVSSPEASTPFLPKIICINVVWTEAEALPFVRRDGPMALEVLLSRPIVGAAEWQRVLEANEDLRIFFPQVSDRVLEADARPRAPLSSTGRFLRWATANASVRRALDTTAWLAVRAIHRGLRWWRMGAGGLRARNEAAVRHVDRMEVTKHPYGILDRPGES